MAVPVEIRLNRAERSLYVRYDDGAAFVYPAEYLRVESPSAEVQGHAPSQRRIQSGKRAVGISALEPVGNYAIRIVFDDGHETGIFSWPLLRELGEERESRWAAYLADLDGNGLHR